jgi:DNA-binding CsgD family transcriptional regulator
MVDLFNLFVVADNSRKNETHKERVVKGLNSFTHQIYEAATNFELWSDIIKNLATFMQASSSAFLIVNKDKPELIYNKFLSNMDTENRAIYKSGLFNSLDKYFMSMAEREGRIIHSTYALGQIPNDYFQAEVAKGCDRRHGYDYCIRFSINQGISYHICFYLIRSSKDGDFEDVERVKRQLKFLYPHIKRSLKINELLTQNKDIIASLSDGIMANQTGMVLLNESGVPFFANDAADIITGQSSMIEISHSSIKLGLAELNIRLQDYIESSLSTPHSGSEYSGGVLRVRGDTPDDYLDILVTPVKLKHPVCRYYSRARVAILISRPNKSSISNEMLMLLYGFTGAESEVAIDLINNMSLKEISEYRDTCYETTKSQIKTIKHKLGVRNQAAVVSEILHGPLKYIVEEMNA